MAEMCRKLESEQENMFTPSSSEGGSVTEEEEPGKVVLVSVLPSVGSLDFRHSRSPSCLYSTWSCGSIFSKYTRSFVHHLSAS